MATLRNIFRRGSRFVFRVAVPRDLVVLVGRREIWRSLQTSNPQTARLRSYKLGLAATQLFDAARAAPMLTREQVDELVREYFGTQFALDEQNRLDLLP